MKKTVIFDGPGTVLYERRRAKDAEVRPVGDAEKLTTVAIPGHKGNVPNKEYKIPPPPKKAKDDKPNGAMLRQSLDADPALVDEVAKRMNPEKYTWSPEDAREVREGAKGVVALARRGSDADPVAAAQELMVRLNARLKVSRTRGEQKALSANIKRLQARLAGVGAPAYDELWTPNHSNPVPAGWRKLSKEAMELAGRAQSAMSKLDKYWEPNRPLFAALRRINEAQRAGDEPKLRAAFEDLRSKLAAAKTGAALDAAFKPGDRVWANPIGRSGGTVKGTVARINASGQVVIESGGREHEFHPSNVRASDVRPVGDAGGPANAQVGTKFSSDGKEYVVISNEGSYTNSTGARYVDLYVKEIDKITGRPRNKQLLNFRV